jgi:pimeloyl-ACP methyl ester carboxylesterase
VPAISDLADWEGRCGRLRRPAARGRQASAGKQARGWGSGLQAPDVTQSRLGQRIAGGLLWLAGPLFIRRGWNPSGMISTIKAEDSFDIGGILGEISAPTLVIGGGRDHFYPTELFRQKASRTRVSSSTRTARGHPPRPALR